MLIYQNTLILDGRKNTNNYFFVPIYLQNKHILVQTTKIFIPFGLKSYGNNKYVVVGDSGTILTSDDTINWTDISSSTPTTPRSTTTAASYSSTTIISAATTTAAGLYGARNSSTSGLGGGGGLFGRSSSAPSASPSLAGRHLKKH